MITKEKYLKNPCSVSSIPYWKAKSITIPDGMKILHQDEYDNAENKHFVDEPYFRLIHNLKGLAEPVLPHSPSMQHTSAVAMIVLASPRKNCEATLSVLFMMHLFGLQSRTSTLTP